MKSIVFLVVFGLSSLCHGSIIQFFLDDDQGPRVTGFVNTDLDLAIVETFEHFERGNFWTLEELPYVLEAVNSDGSRYDVPDDWEAVIDETWGFVAEKRNTDSVWVEGKSNSLEAFGWGVWGLPSDGYFNTEWSQDYLMALPTDSSITEDAHLEVVAFWPESVNEPRGDLFTTLLVLGCTMAMLRRVIR